ncbi:hemolysin family protein [Tautonia plasticadhaerens]|uniref:Magnesium and cobalt efflux protein CorC n=1 Tax=Tautonia plasticadhaerens TaxID=2527974 RepID=A0A518GVX3_9BACT|nr:hemolysin family protein [Tautonia plasticadhaerens]QDV32746.1 Magnesium and cobalt efflux protein CorC [Tautonia plasticadhaerens]
MPWFELAGLLALILANGAFSTAELAIVSARKGRLEQLAKAGDHRASAALELADDPNRFLSTVQIGITLIGTLAGAFGGATLAEPLAEAIRPLPIVDDSAGPIALAVVVVGITYATLILGELVPKRIALAAPERIARLTAPTLRLLSRLSVPLVRIMGGSTDLVLRALGVRPGSEPPVTDEDVKQMILEGIEHGIFEPVEHDMIRGVLRLGDRRAGALMTPRSEVIWLDVNDPPEEIRRRVSASPHSSFPVCDGSIDAVLGIVRVKDLLHLGLTHHPVELKGRLTMPLFLYEGTRGLKVLEALQKTGQHFAVVLDEYGSVEGVLTLTDLFESIVGDLTAPGEPPGPRAVERPDGSWLVDGMLSTDAFRDRIAHRDLPPGDYHTIAGFVITRLGRIPAVGERLEWLGYRFEVVDVSAHRIHKLRVTRLPGPDPPPSLG